MSAPTSGGPSPQALAIVNDFLENHGLPATQKALKKELSKRNISVDPHNTVQITLESLLSSTKPADAHEDSPSSSSSSSSSSSESDSDEEGSVKSSVSKKSKSSSSSSSKSSSSSSSSSESRADEKRLKKTKRVAKAPSRGRSASSSSSSSSASSVSTDSDADDEGEASKAKKKSAAKPIPAPIANPRKRKLSASSSSSESSSESDSSSSSEEEPPTKKSKRNTQTSSSSSDDSDSSVGDVDSAANSSSSDSSSDESSDSEDEQGDSTPAVNGAVKTTEVPESDIDGRAGSSSSGTVVGDKKVSPEVVNTDIHPSRRDMMNGKSKHEGARPTPLAQQSSYANDGDHISNKYISYDYADRAYKDLSVTRGKGFTKEKNKKKRGSYRGGTIDMSGGKGFKFED